MTRAISTLIIWLSSLALIGQNGYTIKPVSGLNTAKDDIACGMIDEKLLVITTGANDLVNKYTWNARPVFYLNQASRGKDFSEWIDKSKLFSHHLNYDEGPASFDYRDSTIYFSTAGNYGKASGNRLKIYSAQLTDKGWTEPVILPFCESNADYTHPTFDSENNVMVFSSDRKGGYGMMDIWYIYKTPQGWSEPVNPGDLVNTSSNELFPSLYNGDIYYSSNAPGSIGGYDLKKANGKQQWKTSGFLDVPFNSQQDDILVLFLNDEKSLVTSNRIGGKGGDDVYIIEKLPDTFEMHKYTARIECKGVPMVDVNITASNIWNEMVMDVKSNANGHVDISSLKLNKQYKMQLIGVDPSLYTSCVLFVLDESSRTVKEIRFNAFGFAMLEMLPFSYSNLNLMADADGSMLMPEMPTLLNIKIEGQLFDKVPGDVGRGEPITILDENGVPTAIAFTNETGKFRFTEVKPQTDYTFKLSEASKAKNILITEKGDKITLPVLAAEVHFQRINPLEAIELINEFNEKIYVSPKDIFVINRIYYDYNSARLTPASRMQLDNLELLLKKNNNVTVEVRSHTDARGNSDYNTKLSQNRAISVIEYMSKKGLNKNRFQGNGLGESFLLNECGDDVPCSEPEHAINRRTEIKLVKN